MNSPTNRQSALKDQFTPFFKAVQHFAPVSCPWEKRCL